jgi:hypothetical protein
MTAISKPAHNTWSSAIVLGAVLCLVVWLSVWASRNGVAVQAALQQARNAEIARESTAVCQKWGMPAVSPKHAECLADLNAVRQQHEQRIQKDIFPWVPLQRIDPQQESP